MHDNTLNFTTVRLYLDGTAYVHRSCIYHIAEYFAELGSELQF